MKGKEAASLASKDALEVFYVGVVLGFRGLYRDPTAAAILAEPRGLPLDLETWAKQTSMAIQLGQGRPQISEATNHRSAPPRTTVDADLGLVFRNFDLGVFGDIHLVVRDTYIKKKCTSSNF
jgi:hypothetical protein